MPRATLRVLEMKKERKVVKERKYIYRENFSRTFSGNRQSLLRSTSIHFPSIRFRRIKEDDTPPLSFTSSPPLYNTTIPATPARHL